MILEDRESKDYLGSSREKDSELVGSKKIGGLVERARRIEGALPRESWLPFGLRTLLATEIPQVRKYLSEGRRDCAEQIVHRLALISFRYGPRMFDSEAVAQLRVLDLELCPENESQWISGGLVR